MKVTRPEWGFFTSALAVKDHELTEAEEKSNFEPPVGQYECTIIGRGGTIYEADDGTTDFSIGVKYLINDGEFAGKEFYSQKYNFNEQGIGWTKAFVKTVALLDEAPNTAQELADALDRVVREQYLVHLEVKFRTYTVKSGPNKGDSRTVIQEKILEGLGASKPPDVPAPPGFEKETISSADVSEVALSA